MKCDATPEKFSGAKGWALQYAAHDHKYCRFFAAPQLQTYIGETGWSGTYAARVQLYGFPFELCFSLQFYLLHTSSTR
jgi:hypothetical protein